MAENDIYKNKERYDRFVEQINSICEKPKESKKTKYYCKNKANQKYFLQLFKKFEAQDLSYARRNKVIGTMKFIAYHIEKDLSKATREDIDALMSSVYKTYNPTSSTDFVKDLKRIWKLLFPEKDIQGRIDDTLTPYVVKHIKGSVDISREKKRKDKLIIDEYHNIVNYFKEDLMMSFYIQFMFESVARPQEILYTKWGDVELFNDYAKIWISEHGKEGTGLLQCINSFPALMDWYKAYPLPKNKDAYIFINTGHINYGKQASPYNMNKKIKTACKRLGINKPITNYSLKRNGITCRRLKGESDVEIQHAARWRSTRQLKVYDKSDQEDAFKLALARNGNIKEEKLKQYLPKNKKCPYCNTLNGFNEEVCKTCSRTIDPDKIKEQIKKDKENKEKLEALMSFMNNDNVAELFKTMQMLKIEVETLKSQSGKI